jgi:hypothetical protein
MSAPAGVHQEARRRVALIVEREFVPDPARCVRAIVALLSHRSPVASDTAAPSRPLRTGDHSEQHDDHVSALQERDVVVEEDDRSELVTSTDV